MGIINKAIIKCLGYFKQKTRPISYARDLGVKVGDGCIIESFNFGSEPWLISIGNHVEIAGNVSFITHDGGTWVLRQNPKYHKVIKYGKIVIHDNVFIGYGAIILPGIDIGKNVIIGAGSVVTRDVPSNSVVAGNPARVISSFDEYGRKCLEQTPDYDEIAYKRNKKREVLRILKHI